MRKVTVSFLVNADSDDTARRVADYLISQARYAEGVMVSPPVYAAETSDFQVESVETVQSEAVTAE